MNTNTPNWRAASFLLFLAVIEIAWVALLGLLFSSIAEEGTLRPEAFLTLLLLAGVVALIAMLATAVAVLSALGLSDRSHSFGLPEGTIRAIIALSLIVIFAMTSIYLYAQLNTQRFTIVDGLTREQVSSIPASDIRSINASPEGEGLLVVERYQPRSQTADDFAKQILTTTATLVVAVSAFYFGAQSVAAAKAAAETRTLRITSHNSPFEPPANAKTITVRLETSPQGLSIEGKVDGKPDPALAHPNHDEFEYTIPSPRPKQDVNLTFVLAIQPSVNQSLLLKFT